MLLVPLLLLLLLLLLPLLPLVSPLPRRVASVGMVLLAVYIGRVPRPVEATFVAGVRRLRRRLLYLPPPVLRAVGMVVRRITIPTAHFRGGGGDDAGGGGDDAGDGSGDGSGGGTMSRSYATRATTEPRASKSAD